MSIKLFLLLILPLWTTVGVSTRALADSIPVIRLSCGQVLSPLLLEPEGARSPLVFVDLRSFHGDEGDFEAAAQVEVHKAAVFNRYGDLTSIEGELLHFFKDQVGSTNEEANAAAVRIIERTAELLPAAMGKETAWLTVRAFTPTSAFDQPRWHTDGKFYDSSDLQRKFAAALKGSVTLFSLPPPDIRSTFMAIESSRDRTDVEKRSQLRDLMDSQEIVQPPRGHGALFVVGNPELSAIHSEPMISGERLFFSLVFGSRDEIQELASIQKRFLAQKTADKN